jgi:hypothetical protein
MIKIGRLLSVRVCASGRPQKISRKLRIQNGVKRFMIRIKGFTFFKGRVN